MTVHLKIQCHIAGMPSPQRGHASDVGLDLTAFAFEQKRSHVFFFDTGISIQMSAGYYGEVVPRSSIVYTDFLMANSVGIIDPDYRGRLFVPLRYVGEENPVTAAEALLNKRIAQLIVRPRLDCQIAVVAALDETERGTGGFGSTGSGGFCKKKLQT